MKPVLSQSVNALRAVTFSFALALGAGATGCADAGPDEDSEEAVDAESEELEDSEDPQAQIILGVNRNNNPRKSGGGFPSIGNVRRTDHSSSGNRSSSDRNVRSGSSSSSNDRNVRSGSSSSSNDRNVSSSSGSVGRTVTLGGGTIRR